MPSVLTSCSHIFERLLIAAADVFQALTQGRSYRDKFSPQCIMLELNGQSHAGKLDKEVVLMVEKNFTECFKSALCLNEAISP